MDLDHLPLFMKVSFDFDGTLEFENVQEYAKELIESGIFLYVLKL